MAAGSGRPAVASAIRCFARSSARASMGAEATLRAGWTPRRSTTTFRRELIAQHPIEPRDAARLLVYRRGAGTIEHRIFSELPDLVDDRLVVVNDTRVVPARLQLRRSSGATVEVLLVESVGGGRVGGARAAVAPTPRGGAARACAACRSRSATDAGSSSSTASRAGEAPLPPYIREPLADCERYQTVYGAVTGSAAAPTAGLHFTPELVERLDPVRVTLHVGLDTFRPVAETRLEDHEIHGERYAVERELRGRESRRRRGCSPSGRPRCACSRRWRVRASSSVGRGSS